MKEVWRRGEKEPYQSMVHVYFMSKRAVLIKSGYALLECFLYPEQFPNRL